MCISHTVKKASSLGFALPTVIILSLILLILGLSTLQLSSSIARSLQDQQWQRMAQEAGQAGVAYATSCLKQNGTTYWSSNLAPNKNCSGAGTAGYIAQETGSDGPRWRSTFAVTIPSSAGGSGPRAKATGIVQLLGATGSTVVKTYTSEYTVVVNIDEGGGPKTARSFAASEYTTCVIASDGQAYCAGVNTSGQLGDDTTTNKSTPVRFKLPAGLSATKVYTNNSTTCVIASDQNFYCSGANTQGQLGDGTSVNKKVPVRFNIPSGKKVLAAATSIYYTCVITADQYVYCSGYNNIGQLAIGNTASPQLNPVPWANGSVSGNEFLVPYKVSLGYDHVCVSGKDTELYNYTWSYCSGTNGYGQIGNGTTTSTGGSPKVFGGGNIVDLEARGYYTCGLGAYGNKVIYCAGLNSSAQLGDNSTTSRSSVVVFITPANTSVDILVPWGTPSDSGANHTCAILTGKNMMCAGANTYGKLGDGTTTTPRATAVSFNSPGRSVLSASSNSNTTCAIAMVDKQIYCAGLNTSGQIGDGTTTNRLTPTRFQIPTNLVAESVHAKKRGTCALLSDNQVYCAGYNVYGQIGCGGTGGECSSTPTANQVVPRKFNLAGATSS